jgi:hypothetical protein
MAPTLNTVSIGRSIGVNEELRRNHLWATSQAHQHVSNAENYFSQGLLIPAAEEHYKAAEAFKACIEHSNDEKVWFSATQKAELSSFL